LEISEMNSFEVDVTALIAKHSHPNLGMI
jgi:hypothetical protein